MPACTAEWTKDEGKDGCEHMLSTFRFSTCTIRDGSNTVEHAARFKQKIIVRFTHIPMTWRGWFLAKGRLFTITKLTRLSFQFRSISCTAWEEDPSTTGLPARSPRPQEHSPHSWTPTICSCPLRSVVIHEPLWSVLTLATLSYYTRPSSLMLVMMDGILPALKKPRPCCCFFRPGLDPCCPHWLFK